MTPETLLAFKPLRLQRYPAIQERETSECKYWKKFKLNSEMSFAGAPNCIDFNPNDLTSYVITGSTKVSLFGKNDKVQRSYSRFNDEAYSGKFRKDGKLLIAGDKAGYVKVFDVKTKAVLRNLKQHTNAVRCAIWSSNALHFLTASDDSSVKRWDLPSQEVIWSTSSNGTAHTDYVRSLTSIPGSPDLFVSGSYDHTARMWDSRQEGEVMKLMHTSPVECCMVSPSGTLLFTASSNEIKVWDLIAGGRHLHTLSSHQKNITGICMDATATRLMSCGLDGHVKIYNLQLLQVMHGMKYSSPILSMALSPENSKLIIGHVDGSIITRIKQIGQKSRGQVGARQHEEDDEEEEEEEEGMNGSMKSKFYKGAGNAVLQTDDALVESERRVRLKPYEKHLKKFSYQRALDAALKTQNPLVVVTVLEELLRRSGLTIALSDRDEVSLEPLLSFTARYVSHPRYARLIVQVAHRVVDLYAGVLGRSDSIDELFLKLQRQVKAEVGFQRQAMRVVGSLDGIISAASLASVPMRSTSIEDEDMEKN